MALKCKIDNWHEWLAGKIAKRIVTEINDVPYREESNIFELIQAMLEGKKTEMSELKDKIL